MLSTYSNPQFKYLVFELYDYKEFIPFPKKKFKNINIFTEQFNKNLFFKKTMQRPIIGKI